MQSPSFLEVQPGEEVGFIPMFCTESSGILRVYVLPAVSQTGKEDLKRRPGYFK